MPKRSKRDSVKSVKSVKSAKVENFSDKVYGTPTGSVESKKQPSASYIKLLPEQVRELDYGTKIEGTPKADYVGGGNGLLGAIYGAGVPGGGIPFGPESQNVSQVGNVFSNLRWYLISNFWQPLSEMYTEIGLIQTIVNVPVEDALRGGVEIQSKKLSEEQLAQLRDVIEREDDLEKVAQGLKWNRLFGGAGVLIITDQALETPLDVSSIDRNSQLEFRAVDMYELNYSTQNTEGGYDAVLQDESFDFYSYYGKKVHKSRVLKMVGLEAPSFLRPKLRGWGFSVVEALVRSVNQYLKGTDLIYELIDEAKIDVFGIKNLTNTLLNPQGTQQVAQRIQLANQQKDFQHALVMDSEDNYEQKTLTFSGLADVMKEIRMQVASDLRMPLTKIFGISAAGFNSGEDDIEIYNGMIESTVRRIARKHILRVVEIRCQERFGFIPDDLSIEFQPLRVMSAEQEETVKEKKFDRLLEALKANAISLQEFQDACNKDDLLGVQLESAKAVEGSDQIGNVPGNDEERLDESVDKEEAEETDAFVEPRPTSG